VALRRPARSLPIVILSIVPNAIILAVVPSL
jgi:hypothetical protein